MLYLKGVIYIYISFVITQILQRFFPVFVMILGCSMKSVRCFGILLFRCNMLYMICMILMTCIYAICDVHVHSISLVGGFNPPRKI